MNILSSFLSIESLRDRHKKLALRFAFKLFDCPELLSVAHFPVPAFHTRSPTTFRIACNSTDYECNVIWHRFIWRNISVFCVIFEPLPLHWMYVFWVFWDGSFCFGEELWTAMSNGQLYFYLVLLYIHIFCFLIYNFFYSQVHCASFWCTILRLISISTNV